MSHAASRRRAAAVRPTGDRVRQRRVTDIYVRDLYRADIHVRRAGCSRPQPPGTREAHRPRQDSVRHLSGRMPNDRHECSFVGHPAPRSPRRRRHAKVLRCRRLQASTGLQARAANPARGLQYQRMHGTGATNLRNILQARPASRHLVTAHRPHSYPTVAPGPCTSNEAAAGCFAGRSPGQDDTEARKKGAARLCEPPLCSS